MWLLQNHDGTWSKYAVEPPLPAIAQANNVLVLPSVEAIAVVQVRKNRYGPSNGYASLEFASTADSKDAP